MKNRSSRRLSMMSMIVAGVAAGVTSCDTSEPSPTVTNSPVSRSEDLPAASNDRFLDEIYEHPLMGVADVNGLYPIADIQDSPSGKRYAIEDTVILRDDGSDISESGLVEREYRQMTADEMDALAAHKTGLAAPVVIDPKIGAALEQALASPSDSPLELTLSIVIPEVEPLSVTIQKGIARGNIVTQRDVESTRQTLLAARRERVAAAQDSVAREVEARGGEVVGRCEFLTCMNLRLAAAQVRDVAALTAVGSINLDTQGVRDADITGTQVVQGSQIKQFIDATYDGEYSTNTDVTFAIIEFDDYRDEHLAFLDGSGVSSPRIHSRRLCTNASCSTTLNFPNPPLVPVDNAHATIDLGIIFGDLRDGQDPGQAAATARIDRSGYAGEAWGHVYKADFNIGAVQKALDDVVARSPLPRVINMSVSFDGDDPTCVGTTPINKDVNDLYELGQLVFKSAGNNGHATATDCTVGSPGAAIGAFTVGGHGNSEVGTESSVRTGSIYAASARGGSTSDGFGRTIIDLSAFAYRTLLPAIQANNGYATAWGTSQATPTVVAAAIDFIDFYKRWNASNFIDDPGVLFANMLLMGDRQGAAAKLNTEFDNLFGAGRLKMRMATPAGLDAPASWKTGSACVGSGAVFTIPVNSGVALSATVNDFKAVVFWYDRGHETGSLISDIDLELHNVGGTTALRTSANAWDNKERVYHSAIGGQTVELRIKGYSVTTDVEGCGTNSQKVYYAYFYEDDARDDADGPNSSTIDRE